MRVALDSITFDAGTQIREAIDQQVVNDYAEAMTNGAIFPPVVLFHDGNRHYIADGFHRFMAAQRNAFRDIEAEVKAGTKDDALWFALGANRANGKRLTDADKRHAVLVAVTTFLQHKSQQQIADQIGCSQGFVSLVISRNNVERPERIMGTDGQTYPATKDARADIRDRAADLLRDGKSVAEVRAATGIGRESAYRVKRELEPETFDRSKAGVQKRREQLRSMAADGYSSAQIAASLGMSEEGIRNLARELSIEIVADKAIGKSRRHDANRILEQIVSDAENLTAGANLIDFASVDHARLGEWIDTLIQAKRGLDTFIRRLTKEKQKHGAAA